MPPLGRAGALAARLPRRRIMRAPRTELGPFLAEARQVSNRVIKMVRGPKKHMKRLNAPSHWMLDKLGGIFVSFRGSSVSFTMCRLSKSFWSERDGPTRLRRGGRLAAVPAVWGGSIGPVRDSSAAKH